MSIVMATPWAAAARQDLVPLRGASDHAGSTERPSNAADDA
jgi:hypothetical protein